jgi:hypothetical protein
VRVGRITNLCVTRSGTMHLTLTCEMHDSRIVQRILDNPRIATIAYYLVSGSCVSFIHDFGSVTLLFYATPILDV